MSGLDVIRLYTLGGIVLAATIIILLERMYPYKKEQRFLREGFFLDFWWYTIIQSYVLGIVISYFIEYIDTSTTISRIETIRNWSFWGQMVFFLVVHDFYIYWFHRWQHHNKYLWRTHEAHHSVRDVDWIAGSRSHAIEIMINQTVEFLPIVLLASPEIAVVKGLVDAAWGMYIHSNINVHTGRLQYVINGPEYHRWHHADQPEAYNKNFATKLAIWDWMFGTVYFPKDRTVDRYGLSDVDFPISEVEEHGWLRRLWDSTIDYFHQQIFAFRPFNKSGE